MIRSRIGPPCLDRRLPQALAIHAARRLCLGRERRWTHVHSFFLLDGARHVERRFLQQLHFIAITQDDVILFAPVLVVVWKVDEAVRSSTLSPFQGT